MNLSEINSLPQRNNYHTVFQFHYSALLLSILQNKGPVWSQPSHRSNTEVYYKLQEKIPVEYQEEILDGKRGYSRTH